MKSSKDVRNRIFQLSDADIDPENESWEDSKNYETSLYAEGNFVDNYPDVTTDNWSGGVDFDNGATEANNRVTVPFDFPPITEHTAEETYPLVVAGAGASRVRDVIDARIANEVLTGTTTYTGSVSGDPGIIDSQDDVGGWPVIERVARDPNFDTDQDGMSDAWETDNGLNPNDPEDRNDDRNSDGYTNLEEYLHAVISMSPVSVKNNFKEAITLHCYPNPTNAGFSIDLVSVGNSTIELFNSLGQLVYNAVSTGSLQIVNDHNLSSGIYFIKVTDSFKTTYNQKLMIE